MVRAAAAFNRRDGRLASRLETPRLTRARRFRLSPSFTAAGGMVARPLGELPPALRPKRADHPATADGEYDVLRHLK